MISCRLDMCICFGKPLRGLPCQLTVSGSTESLKRFVSGEGARGHVRMRTPYIWIGRGGLAIGLQMRLEMMRICLQVCLPKNAT